MAHFYLAEALLYSDKISDSIENLTINAKIESDNDLSFAPSQQLDSSQNHQYMSENINDDKIRFIKSKLFIFNQKLVSGFFIWISGINVGF